MYKLLQPVKDKISGEDGMLTCIEIEMGTGPDDLRFFYSFQLSGMDKETGLPFQPSPIPPWRVEGGVEEEDPVFPIAILGTRVREINSGFEGFVEGIRMHSTGCMHAIVTPTGRNPETGGMKRSIEVDLRRLEGEAIPKLTDAEFKESTQKKPSPGLPSERLERMTL